MTEQTNAELIEEAAGMLRHYGYGHLGDAVEREHEAFEDAEQQPDREPSEEEVEAAGRGLYENRVSLIEGEVERRSWPTWAGLEKADSDEWRGAGRAALIAALEVRRG